MPLEEQAAASIVPIHHYNVSFYDDDDKVKPEQQKMKTIEGA